MVAEAQELLDELAVAGPDILDGRYIESVNPWRSTAAGFGDGRGGGGDLGDQVAARVDAVHDGDAKAMRDHLLEALRSLRRAHDARVRAMRPPSPPKPAGRPKAPGCVNCARFEIYTVAVEAGRCPECLVHWRTHDRDAPERLVVGRARNQRRRPRLHETDPLALEALRSGGDAAGITTTRSDLSVTAEDLQLDPQRIRVMRDAQGSDQGV